MHIACVYRSAEGIRFPCGASPRGPETLVLYRKRPARQFGLASTLEFAFDTAV